MVATKWWYLIRYPKGFPWYWSSQSWPADSSDFQTRGNEQLNSSHPTGKHLQLKQQQEEEEEDPSHMHLAEHIPKYKNDPWSATAIWASFMAPSAEQYYTHVWNKWS